MIQEQDIVQVPPVAPSLTVEGRVHRIHRWGFEIAADTGDLIEVSTQGDGRRLGLKGGDTVRVFGGWHDGRLASGAIWAGADHRVIEDNPLQDWRWLTTLSDWLHRPGTE